jgi:hypothetical protein
MRTVYPDIISSNINTPKYSIITQESLLSDANWVDIFPSVIDYGQNRIINNAIGINVTLFHPGFSDTTNYLCFSHYPDSMRFLQYVEITPDDGSIEVKLDGNIIHFSANTFARPDSDYRIKIKEGMPDIHGRELKDSVIVAFTTPVFTLIKAGVNNRSILRDSLLKNNSLGTWDTRNFSINFLTTHAISLHTLESNIVIDPPIPGVISANIRNVEILAGNNLIPDTTYRMEIKNGLQSNLGVHLDTNYTLAFETENFKLTGTTVGDTSKSHIFSMLTNSKLDVSELSSFVIILPDRYATGTYTSTEDSSGFFYIPDSIPVAGNKITAIVSPDLRDFYKNALDSADTLTFYWLKAFKLLHFGIGNTSSKSLFILSTSMKLDTNSFESSFDISLAKYRGGAFELNADSTGLVYHPPGDLILGDEVQVIVNTNLTDVYGNHIEAPDTLNFLINSWEWE